MSNNNSIINLLNLKEKNLIFDEEFCIDKKIKNITCKFFRAILTYSPDACYNCGHIFDSNIIKYGFKTSNILLPNISGFKTYLNLRKQRFYCKHCNSTFTLKTNIVKDNCFISNNTKLSIAYDAKKIISQKDIGNDNNVSTTTVVRVMQVYYNHYSPNKNYLPKYLCFDEFKSVKSAKGAMSFIFCDSKTGKIVDILEDRRLTSLKEYFYQFSKEARHSVKTIVIDIYKPYMILIKELFPNAKIILDKFHLVQLISRALNKIRVKTMNSKYKSVKTIYNKLKKYWRLLLKCSSDLNFEDYYYRPSFKSRLREVDIIDKLLSFDEELRANYNLYQKILFSIKEKNINLLESNLDINSKYIFKELKTAIKTLKQNLDSVINCFNSRFTNGLIEGINNKIKVIKRVSFGYRSFINFRNRIFINMDISSINKIKVA